MDMDTRRHGRRVNDGGVRGQSGRDGGGGGALVAVVQGGQADGGWRSARELSALRVGAVLARVSPQSERFFRAIEARSKVPPKSSPLVPLAI